MRLNSLWLLIGGQFFSSLADNMAIFLVSATVARYHLGAPDEFVAQAMGIYFAIYVIASPWAGNLSERFPKGTIFIFANGLKFLFFLAIVLKINPAWAYALFGLGAVLYSPAKYGILPYICKDEKSLMHGNALVEGSTIIAIILGNVVGGRLSDQGILLASVVGIILLIIGSSFAAFLPKTPTVKISVLRAGLGNFIQDMKFFLTDRNGGIFSVYGSVVFWMGTRLLQTILFLWVPAVLLLEGNTPIGILTGITAVGTVCGALAAPHLISFRQGSRILAVGALMGIGILLISLITNLYILGATLFVLGFLGGLYLIPINALNEHIGEKNMGAGRAVAVQNFMENLCSSGALWVYTFFSDKGTTPQILVWGVGITFLLLLGALWSVRTRDNKEPS